MRNSIYKHIQIISLLDTFYLKIPIHNTSNRNLPFINKKKKRDLCNCHATHETVFPRGAPAYAG